MSKSTKPTKVPVMMPDQRYEDWKNELRVWEVTNSALGVESRVQAGILFQALERTPRQTVLSELTVEKITCNEGVNNIIKTLDRFYLGNETKNAFDVIDNLMDFKCTPDLTFEKFIIEFQLKVNKVKASGTILSDGMLGYTLLKAANLSSDKYDMVKATCDTVTYNNVKSQIEKIGLSKNRRNGKFSSNQESSSNVKIEQSFCSFSPDAVQNTNLSESSSDEEMDKTIAFYTGENNRSKYYHAGEKNRSTWRNVGERNRLNESNPGRKSKNPTDRYGNVRACVFCKCNYHWVMDCPYAPVALKNEVANKYKNRYNNHKAL